VAAIKRHLRRTESEKGRTVFGEGEQGKELFIITRGTASAYLRQASGADIRLATFAPGTTFGELALLDPGPRSASVIADEELVCYALSDERFLLLSREAPDAAIKLLANLSRELSRRLRQANRTIHQLEE
jgi:CRP-like cAMP-binding protein